jgi:ribosomal-protein-alanine N-acetyltransferase
MYVSAIHSSEADTIQQIAEATESEFRIADELMRHFAKVWVARPAPGSQPVAFLLAWQVADELHILHLGTLPRARRQGAARALLGALLEHARAARTRLVLLEVRRSNAPALGLYRSCGFSATGVRRGYYSDTNEDAIEMMLKLDPNTGSIVEQTDEVDLMEGA